jgi:hypothetical protein
MWSPAHGPWQLRRPAQSKNNPGVHTQSSMQASARAPLQRLCRRRSPTQQQGLANSRNGRDFIETKRKERNQRNQRNEIETNHRRAPRVTIIALCMASSIRPLLRGHVHAPTQRSETHSIFGCLPSGETGAFSLMRRLDPAP